jgi:hypothetical protein
MEYLDHDNGETAWTGSFAYHKNGCTAWTGSFAYYDNGQTAWTGSFAYYRSGQTAWTGSHAYEENGKPQDIDKDITLQLGSGITLTIGKSGFKGITGWGKK